MTDSRLPSRWLLDPAIDTLSDRAFRTLCGSLMWCNENGTDGRFPQQAHRFLHPLGVDAAVIAELVAARLWERVGADIQVPGWSTRMGQSTAEAVAKQREGNAARNRTYRARKAAQKVPRDASPDASRDATLQGQDRRGEDRQGQAFNEADSRKDANVVVWPVAPIPIGGVA